jgi:hypothetical protein
MKALFLLCFIFLICNEAISQKLDYTLQDRERLIRVEEGLKALQKQIDQRFDVVNQRFEALESSINLRLDN